MVDFLTMLHELLRVLLPNFKDTNLDDWLVKESIWAQMIGYFLFVHLLFCY